MNIVVCLKQVPNTTEVKTDGKTGNLIREGISSITNLDDKNALEEALVLKEKIGGKVTVISMGLPQAEVALREALAMGVDEAILISDKAFAGSDTLATSRALVGALKKLDINYDIIFTGTQTIDSGTAQVGPRIAEQLEIPQVTNVEEISVNGDTLKVKKTLEDGYEIIIVKTPVLLTATKELNKPRYPQIKEIFEAHKQEIKVWTAKDIDVDKSLLGLAGSVTKIKKSVKKEAKSERILINKPFKEAAAYTVAKLREKQYI